MNAQAVRQIKERLDLVELVNRYVQLRPVGERWVAPCPFHNETKPSFHVLPGRGFFYCFGCQASGDAIDFFARINGLDFKQTLIQLARQTGVTLDFGSIDPQEKKRLEERQVYLRMYAQSAEHYQRNLDSSRATEPRRYLHARGVSEEMLAAFGIGWSRPDWQDLEAFLRAQGYHPDQGAACGLLARSEKGRIYDRFRDRIMFPIHDLAGRIIAFGGRSIDGSDPKYINTSETPIYAKGEHLYGLHQARRAIVRDRRALLTEGYLDVVALHQFGFEQAVGVLGTALTPGQVKRLCGLCTRVDLLFDGDHAGRKAAVRAAEMFLVQGVQCLAATLPEGEDADSFLHAKGPDAFQAMLDQARPGLEFCVQTVSSTASPREIVDWAGRFLGSVADHALRAYYLPRLAAGLGMSETELRRQGVASASSRPKADRPASSQARGMSARDRQLLAFAVRRPELRGQLAALAMDAALEGEWARQFWTKVSELGERQDPWDLADEEKHFFYQALADPETPENQGEAALWDEVRMFLEGRRLKTRQKNMLQAIAQAQGNGRSVSELLRTYQEQERARQELHENTRMGTLPASETG